MSIGIRTERADALIQRVPREACGEDLRTACYGGKLRLSAGTPEAVDLAASAMEKVESAFADVGGAQGAQNELSNEAFFERIKGLRRVFYGEKAWQDRVRRVIAASGLDPDRTAYDPPKLRVVQGGGHRNPAAAPVFQAHRDTWYSHPSCLLTWWVALHAASDAETFVFYPDLLDAPVPNDSARFDYGEWVKDGPDLRIGWQDIQAGRTAVFPSIQGEPHGGFGRTLGFSAEPGDELIFAGAHLHQTIGHDSGRTRFSLDFRVIDLVDARDGRGAPSVDARCRGSAAHDYRPVSD